MNRALWERIAEEPDAGEEEEFDPPIPTRLAEIRVPTLLIVGDLDQSMTVESMAILGREIPNAETVVIHLFAERLDLFFQLVGVLASRNLLRGLRRCGRSGRRSSGCGI